MSKIIIELDDATARTVRDAAQAAQQPVENWAREKICQAARLAAGVRKQGRVRSFPLHPGAMEIMPGFKDPLEEFSPYV